MPRAKKEGNYLNCKIKKDIFNRLTTYSEYSMVPKTSLVEKALEEYLEKVMPNNTNIKD